MKFFAIFLVFAVYGAVAKPQEGPSGSAEGGAQANGCSVGADGSASGSADASASGCGSGPDSSSGHTYEIKAQRVEQVIPPGYPVMYMYYQISPTQNLTYYEEINDDHPFELEVYMMVDEVPVYDTMGLNACNFDEDGTWDYVVASIVRNGVMPEGHCPVKKGSYNIDQNVEPFTVTFPEMIPCGEYNLYTNLDRGEVWAAQLAFSFTIEDDCLQ